MSNRYYQRSLDELRELAVEFARANPALAPHLSGPSPDPDVERILEGVAFLTGRIHERLDDDFPEFAQGVMQQIFPHYLRPMPSATVMEFVPKPILKNTLQVPAGTYIDSKEIEGTHCRFRTCYDVAVSPLFVSAVNVTEVGPGRRNVELQMEMRGLQLAQWKEKSLRFYVGGDFPGAADVFMLLQRNLSGILLRSGQGEDFRLPPGAIRAVGFEPERALLPYPRNAFPAYRLLQEYFLLKEKFLFFEIEGLDRWQQRAGDRFMLRFELQNLERQIPKIDAARFLLNATPAINLFEFEAEPVVLDQHRADIRLRVGRGKEGTHQIFEVRGVTGHDRRAASKTQYQPLGISGAEASTPAYQVNFRAEDGEAQAYLALSYPPETALPEQETLTVELLCTNGSLPSALRPGDIARPTKATSELTEFRNVLPPTPFQPAPTGRGLLWRLLSHLSLNYLSIANADNLRALLGVYMFAFEGDRKLESANRRRIDAIANVEVRAADRLLRGSVLRGQEITLSISREHFASEGDMYLFGGVLEQLFTSMAALNAFTRVILRESNSGEEYEWPPKLGTKPLV